MNRQLSLLSLVLAVAMAGCRESTNLNKVDTARSRVSDTNDQLGSNDEKIANNACEVTASARTQLDMLKASLDVLNAQLKVAIEAKEANIDSLKSKIHANQDTAALVTAQYAPEKVRCDDFTCDDEVQPVFESCQSDCFANSPDTLRECQQGCQDDAEKNRHDCLASLEAK